MQNNEEFLNEFKTTDKLLRQMYGESTKLGVTCYIDEMRLCSGQGIKNWDNDFSELKRLRDKRNRWAHEDVSAEEPFSEANIRYIREFRERLLKQTDPLSLARRRDKKNSNTGKSRSGVHTTRQKNGERNNILAVSILVAMLILIALIIIFSKNLASVFG